MTQKEAIKILKRQADGYYPKTTEALIMAIKALEQEPITWIVGKDNCQVAVRDMSIDKMQKICAIIGEEDQEPCEDCISRQAVKDILDARGAKAIMTFEHFKELLDKLPSVTPQPKIGHWIYGIDEDTGEKDLYAWTCSECEGKYPWQPKYCPNCGAKMESEG